MKFLAALDLAGLTADSARCDSKHNSSFARVLGESPPWARLAGQMVHGRPGRGAVGGWVHLCDV